MIAMEFKMSVCSKVEVSSMVATLLMIFCLQKVLTNLGLSAAVCFHGSPGSVAIVVVIHSGKDWRVCRLPLI